MDNIHFKQLFRKFSGYVYQFVGQIPDGEDTSTYIIDQFVDATGKVGLAISLTRLSNSNIVIHSSENIQDERFIQLCDLSYEPEPIPDPEPEQTPEEEE